MTLVALVLVVIGLVGACRYKVNELLRKRAEEGKPLTNAVE